jgi:peptidoglycan/LPS O-acetylase OafA/YrhL
MSDPFWHFQENQLGQLVDVFFYVSGFVNYYSLRQRFLRSKARTPAFCLSFLTRLLRLYPVVWVALICYWKTNAIFGANYNRYQGSNSA